MTGLFIFLNLYLLSICLFVYLGSTTPTPTNGIEGKKCPLGHYCTKGTVKEEPCQPGTFSPSKGLSSCLPCPSGYTCPNTTMVSGQPCSTGHYCPPGQRMPKGMQCPEGTYLPREYARFRNECLPCQPGFYCETPGLSNSTGPCAAGYICQGGDKMPTPTACPAGYYCESGTINGTRCPKGTVRRTPGAASVSDCHPCDGGKYCIEDGLTKPSSHCLEGYYCPEQVKTGDPRPTGYQCPRGFYCPNGTAQPKGCRPGTYQPNLQKKDCLPCPAGSYCLSNASVPLPCPAHRYCEASTSEPAFCPNGTYTNATERGLDSANKCHPCPSGHYCQLGVVTDTCTGGYLCYTANPLPTPDGTNKTIGEPCPIGYYCPPGTLGPKKCPPGLVIATTQAISEAQCSTCPAGKICSPGSSIPEDCTIGYYCPYNATRQKCPLYTYNNMSGASSVKDCKSCPAGHWCWYEGENNELTLACNCRNAGKRTVV